MGRWIDKLSDEAFRAVLGRRVEAATEQAFHVVRWSLMVGLARYLAQRAGSLWFDLIYWGLAAMLLGHLASIFLLRPEIPLFAARDRRWKRAVQTALNYALCMVAFMAVMMVLNRLVDAIAQYRFAPVAG